jgi:hypothetical protein
VLPVGKQQNPELQEMFVFVEQQSFAEVQVAGVMLPSNGTCASVPVAMQHLPELQEAPQQSVDALQVVFPSGKQQNPVLQAMLGFVEQQSLAEVHVVLLVGMQHLPEVHDMFSLTPARQQSFALPHVVLPSGKQHFPLFVPSVPQVVEQQNDSPAVGQVCCATLHAHVTLPLQFSEQHWELA